MVLSVFGGTYKDEIQLYPRLSISEDILRDSQGIPKPDSLNIFIFEITIRCVPFQFSFLTLHSKDSIL